MQLSAQVYPCKGMLVYMYMHTTRAFTSLIGATIIVCVTLMWLYLCLFVSVFIPLPSVQSEWRHHRGLQHLHTVGIHNRLFSDIFKTEFRPKAFISVAYGGDSDDSAVDVVHHGNLLTPAQASAPPNVQLPQELKKTEGYATLMLTNPDGHLRDSSLEVLHWMMWV